MFGPEIINARFKLGVIELHDVEQTIKMDVKCFFYFKPEKTVVLNDAVQHVRFENIGRPEWVPHFCFSNEIDEVKVTNESYWLE